MVKNNVCFNLRYKDMLKSKDKLRKVLNYGGCFTWVLNQVTNQRHGKTKDMVKTKDIQITNIHVQYPPSTMTNIICERHPNNKQTKHKQKKHLGSISSLSSFYHDQYHLQKTSK